MTDIQAARVKELRMNRLGYRTIADTLGLTRDIVRNYCKANNMGGYAKATALNIQERMFFIKYFSLKKRLNSLFSSREFPCFWRVTFMHLCT